MRRFKAYISGDESAIPPTLRRSIFQIAVKEGGKDTYETLKKIYSTDKSIDGPDIILGSLGRVQTPELGEDLLNLIFSPAVKVQDRTAAGTQLASNTKMRMVVWEYIKKNWDSKVYPELSGSMTVLDRFLRMTLNKFSSLEVQKDIHDFFADKDQRGFDRSLAIVADVIKAQRNTKSATRRTSGSGFPHMVI